jgi:hypothetical protein
MAFICTVHIPHSLERFQQAEADNPQITEVIVRAAETYMTSHRLAAADGEVIEINEYAKAEDHEAFLSDAGEAIAELNAILGAPLVDKLYLEVPHEH